MPTDQVVAFEGVASGAAIPWRVVLERRARIMNRALAPGFFSHRFAEDRYPLFRAMLTANDTPAISQFASCKRHGRPLLHLATHK
jgi:hypothetical protein